MTRLVLATVAMPPGDDGKCAIRTYSYKESGESDSVRVANFANKSLRAAGFDGERFLQGEPPPEARRLWEVYLMFTPTANPRLPKVSVDFRKYDGCPLEMAQAMMDSYKLLKRELRG